VDFLLLYYTDGRTDRQTDRQNYDSVHITTRDKNEMKTTPNFFKN